MCVQIGPKSAHFCDKYQNLMSLPISLTKKVCLFILFQGFGHLLPSHEDGKMLGVIYDSCTFPQHDRPGKPSTRFTVSSSLYEDIMLYSAVSL